MSGSLDSVLPSRQSPVPIAHREHSECRPPVQSFWAGRPLSCIEQLTIRSFLQNGHPFHFYCYKEIPGVPEGTTVIDAREIMPESKLFINDQAGFGCGSYAPFSDLFRAELLHRRGGWWVDMDVICLKPLEIAQPNIISTSREWGWGDLANVNVLRFEAGHPACRQWGKILEDEYNKQLAHGRGPVAMQLLIKEHPEYEEFLVEPEVFNPVNWIHVKYLVEKQEPIWHRRSISRMLGRSPQVGRITEQSFTLHLWHEMWRQQGYQPDSSYDDSTLYERLRRRYGVETRQLAEAC